ncbi:MAG TPA: UDP-N-acetylmuramoyl-tripeptide--D-alanyl-D-alanine ligase [Gaiellaceae bacterium]
MPRQRTLRGRTFLPGEAAARDALLGVGLAAARMHRRRLGSTVFVGVTGSAGKSTTKDLVAAVLRTQLEGTTTPGTANRISIVGRTLLRTRPRHDFCVAEVAAWRPGSVAQIARVLRPQIAVVTNVCADHRKAFRTLEETAIEKAALVAAVPADGVAVLNADDPLVRAMAERFAGRSILVGESPDAELRAEDVRSPWPSSLSFTLRAGDRSLPVPTQLHGRYWTTAVLAALGVGLELGIPLERALEAVAAFEPPAGRMTPVTVDGITFLRDDTKAPLWSFDALHTFLAEARAARKLLVVGTISDTPGAMSRVYRRVAKQSLAVADEVVFVGRNAAHVARVDGAVRTFPTLSEAAAHLDRELRPGDLVVLKGSRRADHLERLVLARTIGSRCWREACGRASACEACRLLHVP